MGFFRAVVGSIDEIVLLLLLRMEAADDAVGAVINARDKPLSLFVDDDDDVVTATTPPPPLPPAANPTTIQQHSNKRL